MIMTAEVSISHPMSALKVLEGLKHLRLQLCSYYAPLLGGSIIAIPPCGVLELRRLHDYLLERYTLAGRQSFHVDMDASIEAEDETRVLPVKDEVAACE